MGDRKAAYRFLVEKTEEKSSLGRPRHRWDDDINMDLQQTGAGRRLDLCGWGKKEIMGAPWSDEKLIDFKGPCSMESVC